MSILSDARATVEQRNEYLKIPDDLRLAYLVSEDADAFVRGVQDSGVLMQNLTMEAALELVSNEQYMLSVTENGYAKRTSIYEYRVTNRGGSGVVNIAVSERNGLVVSSLQVDDYDEILLLTSGGTLIRTRVADIRITGRSAQGVRVMTLQPGEKVISVTRIARDDQAGEIAGEVEGEGEETADNPVALHPE
jgi:DNA gyrase subunit A